MPSKKSNSSKGSFLQGDIVLVPFPFTDLSSTKTRPALIVSNRSFKGNDIMACGITSKSSGIQEHALSDTHLEWGSLPLVSYVKTGKIASLDKKIIRERVARVNTTTLEMINRKICAFLKVEV